jgi:hypothetical protein
MIVGGGIWLSFSDFWRNLDLSKLFKKAAKVAPLSPEAQAKESAKAAEQAKTPDASTPQESANSAN